MPFKQLKASLVRRMSVKVTNLLLLLPKGLSPKFWRVSLVFESLLMILESVPKVLMKYWKHLT